MTEEGISESKSQIGEVERGLQVTNDLVETKVDENEVQKIREQFGRFALYDDYRGLYNKVVPPIGDF